MPSFFFNDKEIPFNKGEDILTAVVNAGEFIPHFCYHPGLSRAATCRMCLVDVIDAGNGRPIPKLQTACSTPAAEGMKVLGQGEKVAEARNSVMEFLLVNHPLDCPICDQAGECTLQEFSFRFGSGRSNVNHEKRVYGWRNIGSFLQLERNRCIHCTRCVRFTQEISGTHEMGMFQRNHQLTVDTFVDNPLSDDFQGNLADICPVGALTPRDSRFRKRVWKLKNVDAICAGCSRGCNIFAQYHGNEIYRFKPRFNPDVNRWWMCDTGRVSFHECFESEGRQTSAMVSGAAKPWKNAVADCSDLLRNLNDPDSETLVVVSPQLFTEEMLALREFAEKHCPNPTFIAPAPPKEERDTNAFDGERIANLRLKDRAPNSKATQKLQFRQIEPDGESLSGLDPSRFKLAIIAESPLWEKLDAEAFRSIPRKILLNERKSALAESSDFTFPVSSYLEKSGTFINADGMMQMSEVAVFPEDDAKSILRILGEISKNLAPNDSVSDDLSDYRDRLKIMAETDDGEESPSESDPAANPVES